MLTSTIDHPLQAVSRKATPLWIIPVMSAALILGFPDWLSANENILLGLPSVPIPADNQQTPQKVELGKKLFQDTRFSADGKVSCASCHQSDGAFADGQVVAKGIKDQRGTRNTPTLFNVAYLTSQFWDGRRGSLEEQARDPLVNAIEHGLATHAEVVKKIQADSVYLKAFKEVFGIESPSIGMEHVAMALASFERTLLAGNSSFDRYYFAKDAKALTPQALRGFELFRGKARCQTCHAIGDNGAIFTDNEFHSLGIGMEKVAPRLAEITRYVARSTVEEIDQQIARDPELAALGRFVVSRKATDIGKFRTPSLRNVELTAPYMHDGSVATLEEAVNLEVYYRGVQAGRPLILTVGEKDELVAFLRALTSPNLKKTKENSSTVQSAITDPNGK
jgi:cytochrome c peroxidase